jgi:hypothetical protein
LLFINNKEINKSHIIIEIIVIGGHQKFKLFVNFKGLKDYYKICDSNFYLIIFCVILGFSIKI